MNARLVNAEVCAHQMPLSVVWCLESPPEDHLRGWGRESLLTTSPWTVVRKGLREEVGSRVRLELVFPKKVDGLHGHMEGCVF